MNLPAISIVILTKDEEANITGCLDSVRMFDDVHVLDSGSTDATVQLVTQRNIPIHHHAFEGFGSQRNWAIDHIPTTNPWVFHLDADERFTNNLVQEIMIELATDPAHGGYHVPSQFIFADKWLRHAAQYPTYQVRMFHKDRLRFMDYGHGQREVTDHTLGTLQSPYKHLALSKGLDDWYAKHAKYARLEAEEAIRAIKGGDTGNTGSLLSSDSVQRRRALKRLSYKMPFRSTLRFLYMVILKRAFMDGSAGITYARMMATYESMVATHLRLLKRNQKP